MQRVRRTALRDNEVLTNNINALAVTEAKLGNGSVAQAKLKTATSTLFGGGGGVKVNITMPGGSYSFYPQTSMNVNTNAVYTANILGWVDGNINFSFNGWVGALTNITISHFIFSFGPETLNCRVTISSFFSGCSKSIK